MTRNGLVSRRPLAARRLGWVAGPAVAGAFCLLPVASQASAAPAHEITALEEVVVTARKIEERAQGVPMSMQVLTAGFLEVADPSHVFDLQYNVPGLVVSNLGLNGAAFSLRAIADQGGSAQSVATHLNGVYLGAPTLSIARLFDLERVEILKGPQGTLYGRNATGGSINSIARSPGQDFSAEVEVAHGTFDTTRMQGHVNLPLENSAFRLAWIASEGDGFIRNVVDDRRFAEQDFRGLRASYRVDVSDRGQVELMVQHVVDDGGFGDLWLPNLALLPDPNDIRLTRVMLGNPFLETESDTVTVNVGWNLGFATLNAVSGYADATLRDVDDCAGIPALAGCVRSLLPGRHRQLSQEVRLVSPDGAAVGWIVGAYYYDDDASSDYFQFTPAINPRPTNDSFTTATETTAAVFGQVTWRVASRWSAIAGVRLNREEHRLSTIGTGTDDALAGVSADNDANNDSWRVDLEYAPGDDVMLYAGASTGFKSGGIVVGSGGVLDDFAPEELTAYETGIKSLWLDRRVLVNAAAFYYDFRDLQVSTVTNTGDSFIGETDNAAKAEIYGIDVESVVKATERLTLSGGIVWLPKREFVEYRNDRTGDTLSGNDLARAPEWTATAVLEYGRTLRSNEQYSARLEYNYRSSFFYTIDNNRQFSQDDFGLLNLFLRYEPAGGRWHVFASGRNLGDEDYFNAVFLQASPGYPDTYEVGFGYRW